jgi:hypothetical protein
MRFSQLQAGDFSSESSACPRMATAVGASTASGMRRSRFASTRRRSTSPRRPHRYPPLGRRVGWESRERCDGLRESGCVSGMSATFCISWVSRQLRVVQPRWGPRPASVSGRAAAHDSVLSGSANGTTGDGVQTRSARNRGPRSRGAGHLRRGFASPVRSTGVRRLNGLRRRQHGVPRCRHPDNVQRYIVVKSLRCAPRGGLWADLASTRCPPPRRSGRHADRTGLSRLCSSPRSGRYQPKVRSPDLAPRVVP